MMKPEQTRALYLIKLVETLAATGRDPADLLRRVGLSPGELQNMDASMPLARYVDIVESAMSLYDIPDLGFLVGERTRLTEHGVLGYALLSASPLRESLRRYERYQYLQGPLLNIEFVDDNDAAWLVARPRGIHPSLPKSVLCYTIQEWLVGWNQWSALIGHRGAFFDHVEIAVGDQSHGDIYARHLGCPVSFNADITRSRFPLDYLDQALDYADEGIAAMCAEQCEHILQHLDLGHGLIAEVHRQLAAVPGQVPRMDELAKHFFIDARTLRRRLLKEGTTYRDVVTEFRLALAQRYLAETGLPANEIATLVGYADSANLYRIFRQAFDMTPQQFRGQLVNRSSVASASSPVQPTSP
jgi:AraC-like DNA-binding protein